MMMRRALTVLAVVAGAATGSVAAASATPIALAAPCTINSISTVVHADWLKVHTQPSTSSPAVGQLKGGTTVHFCGNYFVHPSGNWAWTYGYGYNGSTKVTGYMYDQYLAGPWQ